MDHRHCLVALREHGASVFSIRMASAFLLEQHMQVRIGDTLSTPKKNGGSPQGSILGNYLFCITTDRLEQGIDYSGAERDELGRLQMGTPDRPPEPHCARSNQNTESYTSSPFEFPLLSEPADCWEQWRGRPLVGKTTSADCGMSSDQAPLDPDQGWSPCSVHSHSNL